MNLDARDAVFNPAIPVLPFLPFQILLHGDRQHHPVSYKLFMFCKHPKNPPGHAVYNQVSSWALIACGNNIAGSTSPGRIAWV